MDRTSDLCVSYYSQWKDGEKIDWAAEPRAPISHYLWKDNGFTPEAYGQLAALPDRLAVRLWAGEKELKREMTIPNTQVCKDSCLEFFVNFHPGYDSRYMNFELNPNGTLLLGFGYVNPDRVLLDIPNPMEYFHIRPEISPGQWWSVEFAIPYAFIREHQPGFEARDCQVITANFFKCGGFCAHYGVWRHIPLDQVNFHRPEFFAPIIFREILER